jgi:hypothetical protein
LLEAGDLVATYYLHNDQPRTDSAAVIRELPIKRTHCPFIHQFASPSLIFICYQRTAMHMCCSPVVSSCVLCCTSYQLLGAPRSEIGVHLSVLVFSAESPASGFQRLLCCSCDGCCVTFLGRQPDASLALAAPPPPPPRLSAN